jgi:hypothetical protein
MECTYLPIQRFLVDVYIGKFYINIPKDMEHFQQNSVHATEHAAAYKKLLTVLIVW